MGREIRRVRPDWEHPKSEMDYYIPLLEYSADRDVPPERMMPQWSMEEASAYQIYEDVSDGTPVSPVFETLEELKAWLIDRGHAQHAAEEFCRLGWAPSMIVFNGPDGPEILTNIDTLNHE